MSESSPAPTEEQPKKTRPRLDRKVFGLVLGTLQKASHDDKLHRASDAAKKRQLLEARLASKLRSETATVRKKEDARRDKITALRKEEDWGVRDSVAKLRRKRIPLLAEFLCTAGEELDVKRSHPPPVYYLPKVLLPEQEEVLVRRREQAKAMTELEWDSFKEKRIAGVSEIEELRRKVSEAENAEKSEKDDSMDVDMDKDKKGGPLAVDNGPVDKPMDEEPVPAKPLEDKAEPAPLSASVSEPPTERKDELMQADEDEVEY